MATRIEPFEPKTHSSGGNRGKIELRWKLCSRIKSIAREATGLACEILMAKSKDLGIIATAMRILDISFSASLAPQHY